MPRNVNMTEADERDMDSRGGLKPRTIRDRKTESDAFMKYFEQEAGESDIKELDKTEAGRARISKIVANYFFSMRVEGGMRPKKAYAEKLRTSIKMTVLLEEQINIFDPVRFPAADKKWRAFVEKLSEEGRADTTHKEEIPGDTLEDIYELLCNVMDTLKNRGSDNYAEMLAKVPVEWHDKLHRIVQLGVSLILILYNVRRGCENLSQMKRNHLSIIEDPTFR